MTNTPFGPSDFGNRGRTLAASLFLILSADSAAGAVDGTDKATSATSEPPVKANYVSEDGVERITLDLMQPVGHVARRDGHQLIVWFDQPRRFDLDALFQPEGARVKGARLPGPGASRWLVLDLAPGSTVESELVEDNRLVITVKAEDGGAVPVAPKPVKKEKTEDAGNKDVQETAHQPRQTPKKRKAETIKTRHVPAATVVKATQDKEVEEEPQKRQKKPVAQAPRALVPLARPNAAQSATKPLQTAAATSAATPATGPRRTSEPEDRTKPQKTAKAQKTAKPKAAQAPAKASAPGAFEVDETALDRALERTLTREGAVLMPFGMIEIEPSLSYVRREFDTPSLINILGFPAFGEAEVRRNEFTAALALRVGLPFDSQLELDVPFNYIDQSERMSIGFSPVSVTDDDTGAFGDLGVGLAKTLLKEGTWWPDVVARVRWDSQTGKSVDNDIVLGGGNHEITGSLSLVKSQDPLAFFGTVAYEATFEENNLDPGDRIGISVGTVLAASPDTSLRASLRQDFIGDAEFEGDTLEGTEQVAATLSVGASSVLGQGILLDASAEVGLTEDAPDYAARLSLPIRFNLARTFALRERPSDE